MFGEVRFLCENPGSEDFQKGRSLGELIAAHRKQLEQEAQEKVSEAAEGKCACGALLVFESEISGRLCCDCVAKRLCEYLTGPIDTNGL